MTVVTCVPNHPRGQVYEGYRNRLFQREEREGIKVIRLWTYVTANEGFLKRTLNYVSYMTSVMAAIPWMPKADVVISTSPQFFNGLAGYFVSRMKRIPWILEIRDLWPESILVVGAIKNRLIIRTLERLEHFAYRKAERIVPVTEAFKRYMVGLGIPASKIEVIKNGVDLNFYRPLEGENPVLAELGLQGKFVASYFGTHGMAHHLETVLQAAHELRDQKDILFLLVGDGAERNRLLKMRDDMGLENVIMLGQQPKQRMPYLWALSNVSMVLLKHSELFKSVIPSKIFESMAMQTPIILGVEGESREIVNTAGAGFCIDPEDSHALAARILDLHRHPEFCKNFGASGRRHVAENYDRVMLARRYESIMSLLSAPSD